MQTESIPRLFAVTRPLRQAPSLLLHADASEPLLWVRGDRGCVGIGEMLRLEFRGASRFEDASRAWREIASNASVDDGVNMPGTGLLAFGTFAFDDESVASSVLIVPRLIIARHEHRAWVTEISEAPLEGGPRLPSLRPRGEWGGAALDPLQADEPYLAGVGEAAARIEGGDIEKIVLARRVRGSMRAGDDLRVPLGRLAYRYTDCWTYAVDGMIGASPETLVRQTNAEITARVLAGTRGRREDLATDTRMRDELLASEKEQHEHAFAVQSVVTALSPHVTELHTSEQPFALELPNVWHLATDIEATPSDGATSLELAAALHPTAAVAGTPTQSAVDAITELEPFDRGRYAGAVGWIDADGEGEWVIALRCAQVHPAKHGNRAVTAYAGGGIVAGSDPQHELHETISKFRPIVEAFAP